MPTAQSVAISARYGNVSFSANPSVSVDGNRVVIRSLADALARGGIDASVVDGLRALCGSPASMDDESLTPQGNRAILQRMIQALGEMVDSGATELYLDIKLQAGSRVQNGDASLTVAGNRSLIQAIIDIMPEAAAAAVDPTAPVWSDWFAVPTSTTQSGWQGINSSLDACWLNGQWVHEATVPTATVGEIIVEVPAHGGLVFSYENATFGAWDCDWTLDTGPAVDGPWTNVDDNTDAPTALLSQTMRRGSIMTVPASASAQFLRIRCDNQQAASRRFDCLGLWALPASGRAPIVAVLGASLTERWAGMRLMGEQVRNGYGVTPLFINRAKGGWTVSLLNASLPEIVAELGTVPRYALLHIGGNDVTAAGAYADATELAKTTLHDGLISALATCDAQDWQAYMSDLTYRIYGDGNDSGPWNDNIVNPIREEYAHPYSTQIQAYNFVFENQDLLNADGIHMDTDVEYATLSWQYCAWVAGIWGLSAATSELPISIDLGATEAVAVGWTPMPYAGFTGSTHLNAQDGTASNAVLTVSSGTFTGGGTGGVAGGPYPDSSEDSFLYRSATTPIVWTIRGLPQRTAVDLGVYSSRLTGDAERLTSLTVNGVETVINAANNTTAEIISATTTDFGEIAFEFKANDTALGLEIAYLNVLQIVEA